MKIFRLSFFSLLLVLVGLSRSAASASQAYGSISNFDVVNDTGHECHGFEIELEDCHSTDVTYTYDYNHYGKSEIGEDNSVAAHPKVRVRWASAKKPDGSWAAFTAIPSAPISATNGHQFTDPSVNFGGEHFGVGYRVNPTAVHYFWLIDNGSGTLVRGAEVQVSTPTFTFDPVVQQVQVVIAPAPPPPAPVFEFGEPVWVKEIRTTTHNNSEIKLRELLSDDVDNPRAKDWRNGEPDEVEVEWQLLQTDFNKANGGANGELAAAPEELNNGDEVVTRRYEFYAYTGPLDIETHEAMADNVAADDQHGVGSKTINGALVDLSEIVVIGEYLGAQMSAFDADPQVGLIDHVSDGRINTAYTARTVVIGGAAVFTATRTGDLPPGMSFNTVTGVLSGTPTAAGLFQFSIEASDANTPTVTKNYSLTILAANEAAVAQYSVDTQAEPLATGTTVGDGPYDDGSEVTVTATPAVGYQFDSWTDNTNEVVSYTASYTFTANVSRSLVAHFIPVQRSISVNALPFAGGTASGDGVYDDGSEVTVVAVPSVGYSFTAWTESGEVVSNSASYTFTASADRTLVANFSLMPVLRSIALSAAPLAGGTVAGAGSYADGSSVTVIATANAGYSFTNWTQGGAVVSSSASYTFTAAANRALVANFSATGGTSRSITLSAAPLAGGSVAGAGSYADGASVTVTATANAGYSFTNWTLSGAVVSSSTSYTFTATSDRTLVANFTASGGAEHAIGLSASPLAGGSVIGAGSYASGDSLTVQANNNAGYAFDRWTQNGATVSTARSYTFTVTAARNLVAVFVPALSIAVSASPAQGGLVEADAPSYEVGDGADVQADANPGYTFANWTENGVIVSTSEKYSFTITTSRTLVANFTSQGDVTISLSAVPSAGGSVSGGGLKVIGAPVTAWARAENGYKFSHWSEGATKVNTDKDYQFTAAANRTLVANFVELPANGVHETEDPDELEFEWPEVADGWVLQESTDLVNWVNSARAFNASGGKKRTRINKQSEPGVFFRLVKP